MAPRTRPFRSRRLSAFAEALRAQGVRCDVLPVEGAGHVFTGVLVEVGTLTEASADFLDHVFNRLRLDAGGGAIWNSPKRSL